MAFTKAPANETYSTQNVKLMNVWESRNPAATKDNEGLNLFYEFVSEKKTKDEDFFVVKRDGCTARPMDIAGNATGAIRSFYHWEDKDLLIVVVARDMLFFTSSTGAFLSKVTNAFVNTTGEVGFTEYLYSIDTATVIATDGTTYGEITAARTWTVCTDPDLPTPHLPFVEYINGYTFVVKVGSADIYNSNNDNPMAWTAGDYISTEMLPDTIIRIGKLNNYLIAFGSASIEYFWDAANVSQSPLQRYDTPVKYIGYLGGYATLANKIYFVGNSATAAPDVYVLEDLKITEVSDSVLRRFLVTLSSFRGNIVSFGGHDFFWITAGSLTYAYDIDNGLWHRMTWKQQVDFPIQEAHTLFASGIGTVTVFNLVGDNVIYAFVNQTYQDAGVDFTFRVITDPEFFDTYNRKTAGRISVIGDRPPTSTTLTMQSTDDDYQTWSTARTVELNSEIPKFERNGQFRRRAWKLSVTANNPVRLKQLDVEINKGQG
jgi:hypothetical protein